MRAPWPPIRPVSARASAAVEGNPMPSAGATRTLTVQPAVVRAVALVLGTSMAFAFARFRIRGGQLINFGVTLPIILPGVITGVALASFFLFTGVLVRSAAAAITSMFGFLLVLPVW